MQTIYPTSLTPEQYVEQEYHQQVRPPENCPNCKRAHALEALAYNQRYITTATALVLTPAICKQAESSFPGLGPLWKLDQRRWLLSGGAGLPAPVLQERFPRG
jgi:hypothetical protein